MTMSRRMQIRLKALLLILMAIFFAQKFVSGKLYFYIGPRFGWLAVLAVGMLIVMAQSYNLIHRPADEAAEEPSGHHHEHDHADDGERASAWPLIILALPLALGVVVPSQPLGASAVSSRGITTDIAVASDRSGSTLTVAPSERNILDWVRAINDAPEPSTLNGEQADVIGFVYRDERFPDDQFMVGRFAITCCVADALAIGVVVQADNAASFETNSWVHVTGTFGTRIVNGQEKPVIIADQILPVQQPEQPYLYP